MVHVKVLYFLLVSVLSSFDFFKENLQRIGLKVNNMKNGYIKIFCKKTMNFQSL